MDPHCNVHSYRATVCFRRPSGILLFWNGSGESLFRLRFFRRLHRCSAHPLDQCLHECQSPLDAHCRIRYRKRKYRIEALDNPFPFPAATSKCLWFAQIFGCTELYRGSKKYCRTSPNNLSMFAAASKAHRGSRLDVRSMTNSSASILITCRSF